MHLPNGGEWNYTFKPATNARDSVRALVGDTDPADPLISDEEINDAITSEGGNTLAAAWVADHLAARFAREATRTISAGGGMSTSIQLDKRSDAFAKVARMLRDRAQQLGEGPAVGLPRAGGISESARELNRDNIDRITPAFSDGMHSNQ